MSITKSGAFALLFSAVLVDIGRADSCLPPNAIDNPPCLKLVGEGYELNGTLCVAYQNSCGKQIAYTMPTDGKENFTTLVQPGTDTFCFRVPVYGRPVDGASGKCAVND